MARTRRAAPSLSGGDGWQQSAPRSLTSFRGQVAVVWFWTLSSAPCARMVDALRALHARDHVTVIGVHAADTTLEADPRRIARHTAMHGMTWPVLLDHRRRVHDRWTEGDDARGWPRTYVVDPSGRIAADVLGADVAAVEAAVSLELVTSQAAGILG